MRISRQSMNQHISFDLRRLQIMDWSYRNVLNHQQWRIVSYMNSSPYGLDDTFCIYFVIYFERTNS